MNDSQKKFAQVGLVVLAVILFLMSWKILPPDDFWLEYSDRIVFDIGDDKEFGFESRFDSLVESFLVGFALPLVLIGAMVFIKLGDSDNSKK